MNPWAYDVILAGVLASVIAAIIVAVVMALINRGKAWRLLRLLRFIPGRGKLDLSGDWCSVWHVKSARYPPEVKDPNAKIQQIRRTIYATFTAKGLSFQLVGEIEAGRYISGRWFSTSQGGYSGAFQFAVELSELRQMSGKWIGFSTEGGIKEGNWEWHRN